MTPKEYQRQWYQKNKIHKDGLYGITIQDFFYFEAHTTKPMRDL